MTIVVVGGGAIGLLVAGDLAQSGQRVALLARPDVVAALRGRRLTRTERGVVEQIALPAVAATPDQLPPPYQQPDLAILCVKGYDTPGALATLAALRPEQVLTLQNGLGHEATLAQHVGARRVLAGVITSSVTHDPAGYIHVTRSGGVGLAPLAGQPGTLVWAAMFCKAGFRVRICRDYRALKWSKALLNMLGNATPAILDMSIRNVYRDPRLFALERGALLEALTVMQHHHIQPVNLPGYPAALLARALHTLPPALMRPLLGRMVGGGRGGKLPSLHADLQRGRSTTEGTFLYGAVAQAAAEAGLAAPINTVLWHTLHAIASGELSWQQFRQQPDRLLALADQADGAPVAALLHSSKETSA